MSEGKKNKVFLALSILSLNLLAMSASVVTSALAAIAKSFPNEPISKIQMLGSINNAGSILSTIVFAYLGYKISKRNIGLMATLIIGIFGMLPLIFYKNLNSILLCIVMIGFGIGFLNNVTNNLIQINFKGEDRATYMGWAIGFNALGMFLFTFLGGLIGNTNWHNLFWVYAFAFAIFLIVLFLVPNDLVEVKEGEKVSSTFKHIIKTVPKLTWELVLIGFISSIATTLVMVNLSILMLNNVNGGTLYTSLIMSLGSAFTIAFSFVLKYVKKYTKTNTMGIGLVLAGLSAGLMPLCHNFIFILIFNILNGIGAFLANATLPFDLSLVSGNKGFTLILSINQLVLSLAGIVAPILASLFHISAGTNTFYAVGVLLIATGVLLLIFKLEKRVEKYADNR